MYTRTRKRSLSKFCQTSVQIDEQDFKKSKNVHNQSFCIKLYGDSNILPLKAPDQGRFRSVSPQMATFRAVFDAVVTSATRIGLVTFAVSWGKKSSANQTQKPGMITLTAHIHIPHHSRSLKSRRFLLLSL